MNKLFKIFLSILVIGILFFAYTYYVFKSSLGTWVVEKSHKQKLYGPTSYGQIRQLMENILRKQQCLFLVK